MNVIVASKLGITMLITGTLWLVLTGSAAAVYLGVH